MGQCPIASLMEVAVRMVAVGSVARAMQNCSMCRCSIRMASVDDLKRVASPFIVVVTMVACCFAHAVFGLVIGGRVIAVHTVVP